ncbi:MAG TPA: transposase [Pirellulales bacterium]|nr:transposase [Pirellulales bacterium]
MAFRRVLAFHSVFGAYGFWLPNDPRGSWSRYVGSRELYEFGAATKTDARRSVAHVRHDHNLRRAAKRAMRFPSVRLTGIQARAMARGIASAVDESKYAVHSCAIMSDHVHLVISWHERHVRRIVSHVKARATQRLRKEQVWPEESRPVWAKGSWSVFLYSAKDIDRAIRYVEQNPGRDAKPPQRWSFVVPLTGWANAPLLSRRACPALG